MQRSTFILMGLIVVTAGVASCAELLDPGEEVDDPGDPEGEGAIAEPSDPAPSGDALSQDDVQALVDVFDDEPMVGGQETPKHVFKFVNDEAFIFMHLNDPNPQEAASVDYVGVAVKGVFCAEDQPDEAFTHFHKYEAESWDGGHGGSAGDEGYWFVHVAVRDHEEPWGQVEVGTDYDFMPTNPPECAGVFEPSFEPEDAGDISQEDLQALVELFDDDPIVGGQDTPKHVFKWVTEDVFLFLHLDNPDVLHATTVHYFGPAVRGQFCEDAQPHEDFTHFHKWEASSWEGGHGGDAGAFGYWFLHNAVTPHEEPWGQVDYGPDRSFMPTNAPAC